MDSIIPVNSLVLYKKHLALVHQSGDKLEIELEDGSRLKVRPKDVVLLHPGPLHRLSDIQNTPSGDVVTAWELLSGEQTNLHNLAELIYGQFTPATAWAAWQLVQEGSYFRGEIEKIRGLTREEVQHEQAARQARQKQADALEDFLKRARQGEISSSLSPQDKPFLHEIEELAIGKREGSRLMQLLARRETPESAHALLLEWGVWTVDTNPYPARLGVTITQPDVSLPDLPEENRLDLTHLPAFAIDDIGSHDPDDAISLDGNRLWVHVADAAALVPPDSPADQEARARGANLYLPEGTVRMLPNAALQTLGLGLQPISPALSFGLDIDEIGQIQDILITLSRVRVKRLTYEEAEERLDEAPLRSLMQIAQLNRGRRVTNEAANISLPEVKVYVESGQVKLHPILPLRSRVLVEEAMLMAGQAIAHFAYEHAIPFLYAAQDPSESGGLPSGMAGMFALLRKQNRGRVSSQPSRHAGLGLDLYTRATSPLRRYSDLLAHQQLRLFMKGEKLLSEQEILEKAGAADNSARVVAQAESLSRRHWTLVYLLQNPGWQGEGILVEERGRQGRLILPELALEVNVNLPAELPLNSRLLLKSIALNLPELDSNWKVVHPQP